MEKLSSLSATCAFLAIFSFSSGASAAMCTSSGVVGPKTVTASLDGAISSTVGSAAGDGCTAMADGNLAQPGPINEFGYTWNLIQKDVEADDGSAGALIIADTSGDSSDSKTGTWTIDLTKTGAYDTFVVGLKPDGGFSYYQVGGTLSGTYGVPPSGISGDLSHGLSHANLYGRIAAIPIPAAAWLFGSALLGLVGIKRRKA